MSHLLRISREQTKGSPVMELYFPVDVTEIFTRSSDLSKKINDVQQALISQRFFASRAREVVQRHAVTSSNFVGRNYGIRHHDRKPIP
jgi:hypothetical protein